GRRWPAKAAGRRSWSSWPKATASRPGRPRSFPRAGRRVRWRSRRSCRATLPAMHRDRHLVEHRTLAALGLADVLGAAALLEALEHLALAGSVLKCHAAA